MSSVLVTGGSGFVGSYVVRELTGLGIPVVSYDRDHVESSDPLVTCVQGELYELPALIRALREHDVRTVVHTAAQSHPGLSVELPLGTVAANVTGTLNLLEAVRATSARRVVNLSSECVYGHQPLPGPVVETAELLPNTPYAVSKVATEHLGRVYSDLHGLDVVSLRVTEVYGPGLRMPEVLKDMVHAAVHRLPFRMTEGADHGFHFVHARDVAAAAVLAATTDGVGQRAYNVAGGPQVTLGAVADLLREMFPGAQLDIGPGHWTGWDRQPAWDTSAAARDLGYRPQCDLERGIDEFAMWLAEFPDRPQHPSPSSTSRHEEFQ